MFYLLRELKMRPVVSGALSFIPGLYSWWDRRRPMGNTASARYARSIWKFHLANYRRFIGDHIPETVAELGPGASLGSCISALCDGVNQAIALDVCPYADNNLLNLKLLDELTVGSNSAARYLPLRDAILHLCEANDGTLLKYVAPWTDIKALPDCSVDFVFSHSVMEHITTPLAAYKACFRWLKPGGIMSHKIDHSSHAITRSWNGHYGIPRILWAIIFGKRPYLLNRMTPSQHEEAIRLAGFQVLTKELVVADQNDKNSTCDRIAMRPEYRVKTSTFVCQRPSVASGDVPETVERMS